MSGDCGQLLPLAGRLVSGTIMSEAVTGCVVVSA
jgi:hypothetical protein